MTALIIRGAKIIGESVLAKVGEKLADYGFGTVKDKTNFKSTLENLERNLKSLSAKANDVNGEINNAELSGKKKRKREVEDWMKNVQIIENEFRTLENEVSREGFLEQFLGGDGAKEMNARVCELVEQSRHFGELALDDDSTRGEAFLTSRLVGEAFGENLERIWKFLVTDKVSSIGIYGMGGVGKSSLAKHINNRLLKRPHGCVLWVTVSQECSIKMLQDKIAHVLRLDLSDEYDEDKRAEKLNRALSRRKNFVLILDDVWRCIDLEKAGVPYFVDSCQLIITTRSLEVCRQIGCKEMVALKPLNTGEGWNLFSEKLGQETALAPQVQEIAMSVAKVCNGLPLGIITIAGSMRGETDIRVWRNTLTELQKSVMENDEMEDQVFKVLKYSFDRLDPNHRRQGKALQLCFLYCSLYPEDWSIERDELVRKFISEELVDKSKSTESQLNEGHSILNRLVNVSLLESASDIKEGDSVKMHDLVRAMALKITEDKTMVIAGQYSLEKIQNEEEWTMDLEKISLMDNEINEIPLGMSPNCPKLSTLLLQNNPLELIPESFFSKMCGLCTLDLSGTLIKELPNSLSDLERLKALLLGGCENLEYVPYLGKLKALKELDFSHTAIREVPEGMEKLVNLKYLLMNGAERLQMLPTGLLLNLPCLRLLCLPYEMQAQLEGIERLKQLERFGGRVQDMSDFNRFIECRPGKQHIFSYFIWLGEFDYDVFEGEYNFGNVDSRFLTYERINKVIVYDYDFKNREEKDVIMLAEDIQHLEFIGCEGLSNCLLDDLSNPRSLVKLEISECSGIECILRYEQLIMAPQELESGFQALEEITLHELHDFMGVIHKREIGAAVVASPAPAPAPPPPQVVFSSLRRLSIGCCNKMKKLGLPISAFQKLESIHIVSCTKLEEIIEAADDDGTGGGGVGEAPVVCLPKLKELMLEDLPRLRSICSAKHKWEIGAAVVASPAPPPPQVVFSSLRRLRISRCDKMKKLGLPISAFQKLESIHIESCEELEEIIQVEADDDDIIRSGEGEEAALAISLPKLRELSLTYLPRLESICKATVICDSIERINLQGCRALKKVPLYFASSIHKREIGAAVVASPTPPPPQLAFSSLRRLLITWCNKMKKLGLPISAFQKLESIHIESCEELEEIIQVEADDDDIIRSGEGEEAALAISLPKLRELSLRFLPRLESICKVTMNCSSIQTIELWRCPTLKKLPLYFASSTTVPPALRQIKLLEEEKEWWDSLEWEHPSHPHLLQPFLRF